ncbi:ATP-dependent RNA helicase HrpA [Aliikangiella sp. IMCC44653]
MTDIFNNIQCRDLGKVISLQRTIKSRAKKKQPVDNLNKKLSDIVAKSIQKTSHIEQQVKALKLGVDTELPIANHAAEITQLLASNQVIIVAGETGCGKTTQLPKICLNAGYGVKGVIAHTQPRRVAATSVARRIAEEVETPLGEGVGYAIRFANKYSSQTRTKLMTDGVLLAEIEQDPLLAQYEVIIIDEAHERSLNIDFLLGFIKQIIRKRSDLKVIITSATIDPEKFSKSFNNAPIVSVEGRSYPVEVRYRELDSSDNESSHDAILTGVINAIDECCSESSGDILIFADGEGQIKSIAKQIHQSNIADVEILPLYARLSAKEQQRIFSASAKRKIIISTNVAETSLTVPGIIFVIDIGTARVSRFSQRNKIQQLPVEKISQASANQRKGRCGRIAPGICIRLYSEEDFLNREAFTAPEIKRTNLSSVVLKLKAMHVNEVEAFPFIESPSERSWKVAFNSLFELGALDQRKEITPIGKAMASLPADPQLARILVDDSLVAVDEMLVICSLMSVREVRERPIDKQQKADQLHQKYNLNNSDILTAIELWRQLNQQKQALSSNAFKKWCSQNLINFLGFLEWRRVYQQLKDAVIALPKSVNSTPAHPDEVHKGLIPGFITHIFQRSQDLYYQGVRGLKVWVHPSSLYFKQKKTWLISAEMIETEKFYARMNADLQPEWIEEPAKHLLKPNYKDIHWRKKKGQVMAYVDKTLLGLPIVNNRLINYAAIDPQLARKRFLLDGLALDQLPEDLPFIKANRSKLLELKSREQQQRLNNICIDNQSLAELYASKLPDHICSFASLKKWLKKDFKARNSLLSFSIETLTLNQAESPDDYPATIKVKGVELNLHYCFAPGTPQDGVSVEIPENMVNQFTDRDFDWLVPGYLKEKVLAALKVLPKPMRRSLIPLNDTAEKCYAALASTKSQGSYFLEELAKVLQKISAQKVVKEDFDVAQIESHLTMKYQIMSTKKQSASPQLVDSLSLIKPKLERKHKVKIDSNDSGFKTWPKGDFSIELIEESNGQTIRTFRAMVDCTSQVKINSFPDKTAAVNAHAQGIARLLLLNNAAAINQLGKGWPDYRRLEKMNLRFGGFRALFDMVCLLTAAQVVAQRSAVLSEQEFKQLNDIFKSQYRQLIAEKLNLVLPLIEQREKIFSQLSELSSASYAKSVKDIKSQLQELWQSSTLLSAGDDLINRYTRYHKGVLIRIKRVTTNFPKEDQALEVWQDWQQWHKELLAYNTHEELKQYFVVVYWMLQEYRLSLFSPGVKTEGGISSKKLQKAFEKLEKEIEAI